MRFEVHLILWVTAALIAAATLFIGRPNETDLSSLLTASPELEQNQTPSQVDVQVTAAGGRPAVLPEVDASLRSIFPVEAPVADFAQSVDVVDVPPALLGIFSTSGRLVAMLIESGVQEPVLVEEGGAIGRFVVRRISADGIVLEHTADGRQESILLRGAGELP